MIITVYGHPAPQGSKNFMGVTKMGRGILREASNKVTPWRADVMTFAREAIADDADFVQFTSPVAVTMVFSFARPKAHYRTGRNSHLLRDDAPLRPHKPPDASKLLRSTEDALQAAGVLKDDALIVEYVRAAKVYCGEDPQALDTPGALIVIMAMLETKVIEGSPPHDTQG